MKMDMLVIGGSLDGQVREWDDQERVMSWLLRPSRGLTPSVGATPIPKAPAPEIAGETYYVQSVRAGHDVFVYLLFSKLRGPSEEVEAEDLLRLLTRGYRKPLPCPECHQTPNQCAYCGYQ